MSEEKTELVRALSLYDSISLVVGTVIGPGVFLKTAVMTQLLGTPKLVLLAWIIAGLLSLAGALTYAELGVLLPEAGGEYVYLRAAYGDAVAFIYGWTLFTVGETGAIAAFSAGFATFLSSVIPLGSAWEEYSFQLFGKQVHWTFGAQQIIAIVIIYIFSFFNCLGVIVGARMQLILTMAKIISLSVIIGGVILFSSTGDWSHFTAAGVASGGIGTFGTATFAALWAYNGWNCMPMVAGEIKSPERNIPRALIAGMMIVLVIYVLANVSYFYSLPVAEVMGSNSDAYPYAPAVATKAAKTFLGVTGTGLVSFAFALSIVGGLNGTIMMTARIPYAMARDGLFFKSLAKLSPRTQAPVAAIIIQAVWASILAFSGTFDQLTNYSIFALWIFYGITASAIFVLRRKMADAPRPYRTVGYPFIPLAFVIAAALLLINTLWASPIEAGAGLSIMLLGLPLYLYFKHKRDRGGGPL